MSYINKKNEPLVNLKITDIGRKNLSSGKLSFSKFQLGDSEMDYSSDNSYLINILRPVDKQHDIQYPVPYEGNTYLKPISMITAVQNEVHTSAEERGFFIYTTGGSIEIKTDLCLVANLNGTGDSNHISLTYNINSITNSNYRSTINAGDYIFIKFKTSGYTMNYSDNTLNEIATHPISYMMYVIKAINNNDSYNLSGYTTGVTTTFTLDRDLPNYDSYTVDAFIYPGKNTINDYYDNETPYAYWSQGLLDFTSTCQLTNDNIPVWNMSIVTIEDIIGLDSALYKGKYINNSRNYWSTTIAYDYFLTGNEKNKIGIIHYTNNSVSNYYAEGFYKNTFKLKIPYLMWHKKQFGSLGLADSIGYTFVCSSDIKYMGSNNTIRYYDLIDQEINATIVGRVLIDEKIILIEDQELISVMSYKTNRNWTLPTPKLTLIEPGACPESSIFGALSTNEALHISYIFINNLGVTGLHCENYATIENNSEVSKDVVFEFPKKSDDPNYTELGYLNSNSQINGIGFSTTSIQLLWQKTNVGTKPDPTDWNYLDINRFLGSNGCLNGTTSLCNNFELFNESTIYKSGFITIEEYEDIYQFKYQPIGDVIVAKNGIILRQASDYSKIGIDGDYWIFYLEPTNPPFIKFIPDSIELGTLLQFYYLIGETTTSSTIRQDIIVPELGTLGINKYNEGIYLTVIGDIALTLNETPNNNVVYLFYNGQLVSSNNYGVYPNGTIEDRKVILSFTPIEGAVISLFYLDNSGLGTNPNILITNQNINNLRINLDKTLLDTSNNDKYDLNDYILLDSKSNITGHTFGDETFFFGNIETDIKATIYKSLITCNVLSNKYINTSNPTFNSNQDKVAFTELGIYDEDDDLVAIGKFSEPLTRKYNSDILIIQATIDF